ncbi:cob(I)yrinic acid a,c-diamide adenosyltransferase [Sodalis glossinidius]|uniref:cob(I)yrinic acid a,c-diamide adenosyltransferase n=1 Tax=Sodalis glossinidius TaxID=63612 RepID=UPI0002E9B3C7
MISRQPGTAQGARAAFLDRADIIAGRGCHRALLEMAYTVSEIRLVKHALDAGVMAQQGIYW